MCVHELVGRGYHVSRSAASRGAYDVIAIGEKDILLIQVKRTKSSLRKAQSKDIEDLRKAKAPVDSIVKKQLWCWVDRKGWHITNV